VRVGVVTTSYPRFDGDPAGCFVAEHVRFLVGQGYTVEVVAAGEKETGRREQGTGNREQGICRVESSGLFYAGGGPEALEGGAWGAAASFTARLTVEVARRARRWDAAVCHWLIPSALAAVVATRVPVLAIAHSGDVHTLRRIGALGGFAALAAARPALRVSFVTAALRDLFLAAAPRPLRPRLAARSQVCPMGIDVARFAALVRSQAATPQVLFLGRLVPVKGAAIAAAAARLWQSEARLVVAGAGPEEDRLRRLAASAPPGRICVVGEVHGAARDRLLAESDIALVPSIELAGGRTEGMPLAALEAMAAGSAVVASAVGGLADLPAITRVPPSDPDALAAAVDHLIAAPAARLVQLEAQRRFVAEMDWSQVGRRLLPGSG
jgi:glycosyltransferase involved in cell wall biosynthesis